jgi:hypothetical protein
MNAQMPGTPRSRAVLVFHLVLWTWLIGLSAAALVNWKAMPKLAQQDRLDAVQRQQQGFDDRLSTLAENIQALRTQPQAVTADILQSTREALEARLAPVEQAVSAQVTTTDLAALHAEIEQLKVRQGAMQVSAAARPRTARSTTMPKEESMPFRVIGAELRAGQPSVSVAPVVESLHSVSADLIQPVLVGESVGAWRLQAIDGQTAVFRAGEQTRRVVIPG